MSDTDRIENLEITLAHQDQQIQDMSEMITAQWKEIDRLKRHIQQTEEKLQEFMDSEDEDKPQSATEFAARNKPPHY